jgi:hypothetical protein
MVAEPRDPPDRTRTLCRCMLPWAMHWSELRLMGASLALVLQLGCDKEGDTGNAETGDVGEGDTSTGDGDGDGDGDPILCPEQFPSFDKACTATNECAIAMHTISCCGSIAAIGINAAELAAFEAAEAVCDGQYPECDCAPFPTSAEDGSSSEDPSLITVECVAGSCTTSVP